MADSFYPKRGAASKIVKYNLQDDLIELSKSPNNYTLHELADKLNTEYGHKIPKDDRVDYLVVYRFLEKVPEIKKELIKKDQRRVMKIVNEQIDTIHETNVLYKKTKCILEKLEKEADSNETIPNPHHYKALVSEMREMIKIVIDLQKEIKDFEAVQMFMEIVLKSVQENAPEALPKILKTIKSTKVGWVAGKFEKQNSSDEEVKEVLDDKIIDI